MSYYITPGDRDNLYNINSLRAAITKLVDERRAGLTKSSFDNASDLLSILLHDELYANENDMIIDECMTFVVAAT